MTAFWSLKDGTDTAGLAGLSPLRYCVNEGSA